MAPIKAVGGGCEDAWFFWIDETSGVADCKSEQGVDTLVDAAAAAAAADAFVPAANGDGEGAGAAEAGGEKPRPVSPRVVDPLRLTLEDLKIARMDKTVFDNNSRGGGGGGGGGGAPEHKNKKREEGNEEGAKRGAKRPRQDGGGEKE